jgi:hypothetical protein
MGLFSTGEFRPPVELAAMSAARVAGRGSIELTAKGLRVRGALVDSAPPIANPAWVVLLLLGVALLVAAFVPHSEWFLTPFVTVVTLGWMGWRFANSRGRSRTLDVPWTVIEHVVRMPADPEVLGIVLSRPIAGRGTPEQIFFAPAGGVDELVVAFVNEGPDGLEVRVDTVPAGPPRLVAADGERIG